MFLGTVEPLLWLGHLYSRDTSIKGTQHLVPEKCPQNLCICMIASIEGTPLFRAKGHFFRIQKLWFNLHSEDTLALKKWMTTKIVDKF